MTYILLVGGFVFLIVGANFLVDGASSCAKKLNISDLVIGLTIVAFGTSAPELFVNLFASVKGTTDIAIGNIVGSNIANLLLILGMAAVIYPLKVGSSTVWKEIPMSLLAAILLLVMANDSWFVQGQVNLLSRGDGIVLIAFFSIFLYYTFGIAKQSAAKQESSLKEYSWGRSVFLILLGLTGLVVGGQLIVGSATTIALQFGLSSALIGLTIVAVGTSLPELATSAVAAYKRNADIAVGNVVGSNIFNIFWILGVSSVISPLPFKSILSFDTWVVIASSLLLFIWMFLGKRHTLERWQGAVFMLLYILYIVVIVLRG